MSFSRFSRVIRWSAMLAIHIAGYTAYGQVSTTAYRALGQADLRRNGVNGVQGVELNNPLGLALDPRTGQTRLYIADTLNSRVLAWPDVNSYQIGDPPALILGQRGPEYSIPLGIGAKGLNGPMGMAVDPTNGNLYVADVANNRVVRFLAPFDNPGRIEPDAVYGQANFTTRNAGATSSTSLNQPRGLAFDPSGNLWVADTGYHRVLRFAALSLNNTAPVAADLVIGQRDFLTGAANGGGNPSASVFDTPVGLAFDPNGNLYVADFRNARVLRFTATAMAAGANAAATAVWGQANFSARGVPPQATGSLIAGPEGIAVDGNGNLYVADLGYNRVVVFPVSGTVGASARSVLGQPDFTTSTANTGSSPFSSPGTLAGPADVKLDANGNLFVADGGNNRVLVYPAGARSANRVWGQLDFSSTGVNQVKPGSLNVPYSVVIDYSSAPYALYVSDTANHRVLVWRDSARFRSGDPADLVIGQPNMRTAAANVDSGGTAATRSSLSSPAGLAVTSNDGTLYVADSGNNRVLRFPRPVNQGGRIMPDAVIGQPDFTSSTSAAVSGASLSGPGAVALGPDGNLFVADSGNNRVLEFATGAGNGAAAIRVYGQPNLITGIRQSQVSPQTLWNPLGLTVDQASNLYVCDTAANRILVFANTQSAPPASYVASYVIGQGNFATSGGTGLRTPSGVTIDSDGNIYVADTGNNRVLMYPSLVLLPIAGATPAAFVGQPSAGGTAANWDSTDGLATANGLFGPVGVYVDRQDTLYVGDVGNHRLAHFLKPATVVNAATFQASVPLAPGGLATLFSNRLSQTKTTVSATTWPTAVANRQLMINDDTPAPIYYLDAGQMNFQMPSNATTGVNRVAVRVADTEELVAGGAVVVNRAAPGLFTMTQSGSGQGAVVNQDGTLNSTLNPAPAGSTVVLYGTGQGQVSPAVPDGTAAPMGTLSNTVAVPTSDARTCLNNQPSMCVSFGGTAFGDIKYSGLAPGFIGLWQINVQLPAGITGNAVPVRVTINGTPSNTITIAVR